MTSNKVYELSQGTSVVSHGATVKPVFNLGLVEALEQLSLVGMKQDDCLLKILAADLLTQLLSITPYSFSLVSIEGSCIFLVKRSTSRCDKQIVYSCFDFELSIGTTVCARHLCFSFIQLEGACL